MLGRSRAAPVVIASAPTVAVVLKVPPTTAATVVVVLRVPPTTAATAGGKACLRPCSIPLVARAVAWRPRSIEGGTGRWARVGVLAALLTAGSIITAVTLALTPA
jgi:hypothetical protein